MNRHESRIIVRANTEGRVVLSLPNLPEARTMAPKNARDLAQYLLAAADEATETRNAQRFDRRVINSHRHRPTVRAGKDHAAGLVRLSLGSHYLDVPPALALRHADHIVDVVEEMDARTATQPDPEGPVAAAFASLAEAAHEAAEQ
ncbi:hypothetical protein ACFYE2_05740 [Kocuria sp. CPCC 205300]|uniref:hypothetical protein n=1 Tax=Kocuria sabuli TaxID=3071448 RepID=UPI0036DBDFC9